VTLLRPPFRFLDHGPLVDGELELVPAQPRWVDELLAACRHPLTVAHMPREARLTRTDVEAFLAEAPFGRFPGDENTGRSPAYQFWMLLRHGPGGPADRPPLRIAGGLSVRLARTPSIERYYGHVGYHVYPAARGHHYAYRATRLVLPLLRAHGLRPAWVTCDPHNVASRRTIERLGGRYVETVPVPPEDPLYARGEIYKCRYRLDL
jgi:predicted acetyltransferase